MTIIFDNIEKFYKMNIYTDYKEFLCAKEYVPSILPFSLPDDITMVFNKYTKFKLGTYVFRIDGIMYCNIYGPYIEIAKAYYGNGLYATWNYYCDKRFLGKRIDDAPQKTNTSSQNIYASFTDMLQHFYNNIHKYDIKNGKIVANYHILPLT